MTMTTYNKLAIAIGLASGIMVASQAQAFENVHWKWHGHVDTHIKVGAHIDPTIEDPGGLVMVENFQKQIGDVSSEAVVSDISYGSGPGETTTEVGIGVGAAAGAAAGAGASSYGGWFGSSANAGAGAIAGAGAGAIGYITTTTTDPVVNADITRLESLENAATSVGNNASIESDAMVNLHNEQFLAGGYFQKANIDSVATVDNILNLSVDNAATSVGNNLSVTQDTTGLDTALIADNTQFSLADVTSTASVTNVMLGLPPVGSFEGPVINNAATSVGNNVSINVGPQ
ncbi:hypothetical protein Q4589_14320 [Cobetia marina]|uniref:hypothetical protein n=1 Tax=Cobetia marina TaxID=28258 RepID=UPI0026E2A00B|nr:hypothetical protein [Cobetia marina]MDO6788766.1 hypothetical protein [Cobetia marina]